MPSPSTSRVTAEVATGFEHFSGHDLAAIVSRFVVPFKRRAQARVHPDVEIGHHEYRCLQPLGQIERFGGEFETLGWIFREQQYMLGIASATRTRRR
jgi:hypothetical protein